MQEEKIKELIDFLQSLGLEGPRLEKNIRGNIQRSASEFNVNHVLRHGEELMRFDLRFKFDMQFNSYHLTAFTATHCDPIIIDHKIINGIDTAQLEERMKATDWVSFFERADYDIETGDKDQAGETLSLVNKLSEPQSLEGSQIQDKLIFKYWPEHIYDGSSVEYLKEAYEKSQHFIASKQELCHANLAYHIVSGKWDKLKEDFSTFKLDEFPDVHWQAELKKILTGNPDQVDLKFTRNEPEGLFEIAIPVKKDDGWYKLESYTARLTPYPPIEHGQYNGINTEVLEKEMRKVDWRNDDELFTFHEHAEPEFKPKVNDIQEQVYRLSLDMVGTDIADKLQVKYWAYATFFEDSLQQSAWDYLDSLPKREHQFPVELEAKAAFNLLCGRSILQNQSFALTPEKSGWARLDLSTGDNSNGYPVVVSPGFDRHELEATLQVIPAPFRTADKLGRGDIVEVTLFTGKNIYLEADPERKTLKVYTEEMRPVPINFHLDPEWKPAQQTELNPENQQRKPRQNIIQPDDSPDKNKGLKRNR